MALDINIRISADPAFLEALNDIAGSLAAISITQIDYRAARPEKAATEEPAANPQTELATAFGATPVSPKKEKEIKEVLADPAKDNPDSGLDNKIIDKKLLPKIREAVASYCNAKGDSKESTAGHDAVKAWIKERNIEGLSKMTYKDMDDFLEFLGQGREQNA